LSFLQIPSNYIPVSACVRVEKLEALDEDYKNEYWGFNADEVQNKIKLKFQELLFVHLSQNPDGFGCPRGK
jgi:hypothetical protein